MEMCNFGRGLVLTVVFAAVFSGGEVDLFTLCTSCGIKKQ